MSAPLPADVRCRSCEAEIVWALTERGKPQPVDATPVAGGNLKLTQRPDGVMVAEVVKAHLTFGRSDLHMPHHATCPDAKAWRKSRPSRRQRDQAAAHAAATVRKRWENADG